jgi:DNA-binding NarL/FixJ family response regulator
MLAPKVLVVDDYTIVAQGVASLLQHDFEVVGIVPDSRLLVQATLQTRPDVVVSDIAMPFWSGLEALRQLRDEPILSKVIFLTVHVDGHLAVQALRAGASGFLAKHSAGEELVDAIHHVLEDGVYVSHQIAECIARSLTESITPPAHKLTQRQREVLGLMAKGCTMKKIASELRLSRRTVETHKYDAMEALGLHTTAELIRYALAQEMSAHGSSALSLDPFNPRGNDWRAVESQSR